MPDNSYSTINNSILIGGCGRSGTSILGRLIASCNDVEYTYDPPFIFRLLALRRELSERVFKELMNVYLYDEFFLNSIAGRNINFNKNDLTYIGNTKELEEIDKRLLNQNSRAALIEKAEKHTLAFKVTDSTFAIKDIRLAYPGINTVFIYRDPNAVIASLIQKKWFADESLSPEKSYPPLIPCEIYKDVRVPCWVEEDQKEFWVESSIEDRSAYYYHIANRSVLENLESVTCKVSFNSFVSDSLNVANELLDALNLEASATKTKQIVGSIKKRDAHSNVMNAISSDLAAKVKDVYNQLEEA